MNVDSDNFHEIRQQIQELQLIPKCQYISFDLQFTGLKFQNNERERHDMFLNEKYQKMAAVSSKFNIIQIGITFILKNDKEPDGYLAYPYNFYVFPRENFICDPVISLQAGCVQFNTNQNMDWNRWIKKGINFVKISDVQKYLHPDSRTYKQIFDSLDEINQLYVTQLLEDMSKIKPNETQSFQFPRFNAFIIKKAVERYSQENDLFYHFNLANDIEDDKLATITVKALHKNEHHENYTKKIQSLVGFTLLFEQIWNSDKIFIGHNCLYDILFIYQSFVHVLPNQYNNFKKIISQGRKFYDTKFIANQMDQKDKFFPKTTSLEEIYKFYRGTDRENKQLKLAAGFEGYDLSKQVLHQAGFDSYLTGWVFFQLHKYNSLENQGKFNIFKSFYHMNIRNYSDGINKDIVCFVVPVASYSTFIQLEELRKMKFQEAKKIRNLLNNEDVMKFVYVYEGLKEIFVYTKQKAYNALVTSKIHKFQKEKNLFGVKSLSEWIKLRSQNKPVISVDKAQSQ